MHSILLAIKQPSNSDGHNAKMAWEVAMQKLSDKVKNTKGIQELAEGVLLLDPKNGLPALGCGISLCEERNLSYKVLLIQEAEELDYPINE